MIKENGYILAIDAGTTSSRALIFDKKGSIVSISQHEFTQHYPKPGWVEHDAIEIWHTQLKAIKEALSKASISPHEIVSVGITNQRETTVIWDRKSGQPIGNAIVWQDRRTSEYCEDLKARGLTEMFRERTGLLPDPYFSGTKIRWILQKHDLTEKAKRGDLAFGTIDSWLVWNLSKGAYHVTDVTNASRTLVYNIHTLQWDTELLDILDIPKEILPHVCDSSGDIAKVDVNILGAEIPITGMAGDQQSALFGQLCLEPGMAKNTYGTGCFTVMNTGNKAVKSENGLLSTIAWKIGGKPVYALEGSVFVAGALVQWLRDELGIINKSSEIGPLAESVPDNGGVTIMPALSGLGTPHWDPYARGAILGITRGTGKAHIARAALEAIALRTMEVVQAMDKDSGIPIKELRVDGGASKNDLLMQIQGNLLEVPIIRPQETETTAMGAGFLAGLGIGFWGSVGELANIWQTGRRYEPDPNYNKKAILLGWQKGLKAMKGWAKDS